MSIEDVRQVLIDHETNYKSPAKGTDKWRWLCSCGQEKFLETRELCVMETREHLAQVIDQEVFRLALDKVEVGVVVPSGQDHSIPTDLSIMSYLIREVDCGIRHMPDARHLLGDWFHKQDAVKIREEAKARMRRLKQITDAINEEFWSLFGSQA